MADTTVRLGNFVFQEMEIPEAIQIGGQQAAVIHKLVGGRRIVNFMGRDDAPITWSGLILGPDAIIRHRQLDAMRKAGGLVAFSVFDVNYQVFVRAYTANLERHYRIAYSITLEVVQEVIPSTAGILADLNSAITGDNKALQGLGSLLGDATLSSALATLDSAVKSVSSFATAAQATLNSVITPLQAVQSRVTALLAATSNTIRNVTTVGGLLPNNPIAQQANKLSGQVAAFTQQPLLFNLQNIATRMQANLSSVASAPATLRTVTVGSGTLFDLAQQAYGDPTQWTKIAQANNLNDPIISGVTTLKIPQ